MCRNFDVDYPANKDIRYIHKVIEGQDVFYFANIGSDSVDMPVNLRGKINLQSWDPHTGNIRDLTTENVINNKTGVNKTTGNLRLKTYQSIFWIGNRVK